MSWYELFNETWWRRHAKGKIGPGVVAVKKGKGHLHPSEVPTSPFNLGLGLLLSPVSGNVLCLETMVNIYIMCVYIYTHTYIRIFIYLFGRVGCGGGGWNFVYELCLCMNYCSVSSNEMKDILTISHLTCCIDGHNDWINCTPQICVTNWKLIRRWSK